MRRGSKLRMHLAAGELRLHHLKLVILPQCGHFARAVRSRVEAVDLDGLPHLRARRVELALEVLNFGPFFAE